MRFDGVDEFALYHQLNRRPTQPTTREVENMDASAAQFLRMTLQQFGSMRPSAQSMLEHDGFLKKACSMQEFAEFMSSLADVEDIIIDDHPTPQGNKVVVVADDRKKELFRGEYVWIQAVCEEDPEYYIVENALGWRGQAARANLMTEAEWKAKKEAEEIKPKKVAKQKKKISPPKKKGVLREMARRVLRVLPALPRFRF